LKHESSQGLGQGLALGLVLSYFLCFLYFPSIAPFVLVVGYYGCVDL
jgi:hypothetical protein